jgi:hypothetical protein
MKPEHPIVDPIELARGVLSAVCFVNIGKSREVHVTKLSRYFDRAGVVSVDALKTLSFLREAESLESGYWIPAPTRTVPLSDEIGLIVAVQPTEELKRHFSCAQRAGQGRIIRITEVANLPTQPLKSWREADGLSAAEWAQSAVKDALNNLAPSVGDGDLQVFGLKPRSGLANRWETHWVRPGDASVCDWQGVSLFRTRTGQFKHRYFLGRHRGTTGFLEGPTIRDYSRMQYGLAALNGRPFLTEMTVVNGVIDINLPLSPPTSIKRLLTALCDEDRRAFGRTWHCRIGECESTLYNSLKELSGEVLRRG